MRLRQLGSTQSVTFVVPPEVNQRILDVCSKGVEITLDSSHVVTWLLDQTCASNRELQSLYLSQGTDFCHRMQASSDYKRFLTDSNHRESYMKTLQQPEQQTLEQLYKPQLFHDIDSPPSPVTSPLQLNQKLRQFMEELKQMQKQSHLTRASITSSAMEEVEQEREVACEIEEEREVQLPSQMKAHGFPGLHKSILDFVKTGVLTGKGGYVKAFDFLESTQLGLKYGVKASSFLPLLHVSTEFTRAVKMQEGVNHDNYTVIIFPALLMYEPTILTNYPLSQRPVSWILWSTQTQDALVIIPEEAEELIPIIRTISAPRVTLIRYTAAFTKRMLNSNGFDCYALPSLAADWTPPSWLPLELGILAGRLYFEFSTRNQSKTKMGRTDRVQCILSKIPGHFCRGGYDFTSWHHIFGEYLRLFNCRG